MIERTTVLSVQNLSKIIDGRTIVSDLSLQIAAGEVFGFLGPNGAGKTTTIRMLVGLTRPTTGTIHIAGFDLQKQFQKAIAKVGSIIENPALYSYLTGRENLECFARMMPDVDHKRINQVIEQVQLSHRIDEKVKTYSLGMKQRLGIALALLGHPALLILDEPTNGLDPAGIRELRAFIRQLAYEEGIGVLVSSHILHEVQLLCDRVAIIHEGKILKIAPIDQLVSSETRVEWQVHPLSKAATILQRLHPMSTIEKDEEQNRLWLQMPIDKIAPANERLIAEQVSVRGILPQQQTLEDIFLQLTRGDRDVESHLQ